jgi:hypothetical protein
MSLKNLTWRASLPYPRQALVETRWLLGLARTHDVIRGVVGWVALTDPKVDRDLEQ